MNLCTIMRQCFFERRSEKSTPSVFCLKFRNYRFYVAKYALTPAFRLGITKTAELGFSQKSLRIFKRKIRAKAQKLLIFSPQPKGWG